MVFHFHNQVLTLFRNTGFNNTVLWIDCDVAFLEGAGHMEIKNRQTAFKETMKVRLIQMHQTIAIDVGTSLPDWLPAVLRLTFSGQILRPRINKAIAVIHLGYWCFETYCVNHYLRFTEEYGKWNYLSQIFIHCRFVKVTHFAWKKNKCKIRNHFNDTQSKHGNVQGQITQGRYRLSVSIWNSIPNCSSS